MGKKKVEYTLEESDIKKFMNDQKEVNDDTLQILKLHNDRIRELILKVEKLEKENRALNKRLRSKTSK